MASPGIWYDWVLHCILTEYSSSSAALGDLDSSSERRMALPELSVPCQVSLQLAVWITSSFVPDISSLNTWSACKAQPCSVRTALQRTLVSVTAQLRCSGGCRHMVPSPHRATPRYSAHPQWQHTVWSTPCPVTDASHLPAAPSSTLARLGAPQYSHGAGCVQHPLPQLINDTVHPITSKTLDTFI